jgi:hypothetical protein
MRRALCPFTSAAATRQLKVTVAGLSPFLVFHRAAMATEMEMDLDGQKEIDS